ncbi:MAG: DUF3369 domain-containing protein [Magnetococcales bacterium]|nr:DUF3369 domain-containing protein [Magnetococcales bacterium]
MAQKIIRKTRADTDRKESATIPEKKWKLLVVDDDHDVHEVTRLALFRFRFDQKSLEILHAYSGEDAKGILAEHADIAVALVDVVMETDMAGLTLVQWIREVQANLLIRIIIRTGQPGHAPELFVINNYDIDDYKEKTELTRQKLHTSVRGAIKSYRDLMVIENTRRGLEFILDSSPRFFRPQSMESFFQGVLTQVVALCHLGGDSYMQGGDGETEQAGAFIATNAAQGVKFQCGIGKYQDLGQIPDHLDPDCSQILSLDCNQSEARHLICLPMKIRQEKIGNIFIESTNLQMDGDCRILQVMANQCAAAFDNSRLYQQLEQTNQNLSNAYDHAIFMLAMASEIKDIDTGNHLHRIRHFSEALASRLGLPAEQVRALGQASLLHDLGKLGIPDAIIRKPGKLTSEEFEVIKTHPALALQIIGQDPRYELARQIAFSHHERWDGTGYPQGLKGEEIPFLVRIVSVVDVFDALISMRSYKQAMPMHEAMAIIEQGRGSHFDPVLVDAMVDVYRQGVLQEIGRRFSVG